MPSLFEHLDQARENMAFLSTSFASVDNPRWRVIVCFYVAVHYIDAYLAKLLAVHPDKHERRFEELQRQLRQKHLDRQIFAAYCELYNASIDARYNCVPIETARADRAQKDLLPRIDAWVAKYVATSGRF